MNETAPINRRSFKIICAFVNIGFWIGLAVLVAIIGVSLFAMQAMPAFSMEGFVILPIPGLKMSWGITIIWVLLGVALLWLLRQILNSMKRDTPFTEKNAKRLFAMGILALAQTYVGQWNAYRLAQSVFDYSVQNGLTPVIQPQFQLLPASALLGICLVILSEVFRYGAVLQQEHDTTV